MLRAQQRLDLRRRQQEFEEVGHEPLVEQPVLVFGECGRVPAGIVGVENDKPAEQQVVVQLLDQHPLRADALDRLQQQG